MLILHEKIYCDPSSEPSQQDGSEEGSRHMVLKRDKKNYHQILPVKMLPNQTDSKDTMLLILSHKLSKVSLFCGIYMLITYSVQCTILIALTNSLHM